MKNPNGYGSVDRMKGKRRRPYRVRITDGYKVDEEGNARQVQRTLGFYATYEEAVEALAAYNRNPVSLDPAITFAEIFARWSADHFPNVSAATRASYSAAYNAVPTLHGLRFREIRRNHLQRAIDVSGKNLPTLQNVKIVLGFMYRYAMQNDLVEKDYSQFVDLSRHKPDADADPIHTDFKPPEISALWERTGDPAIRQILMLIYSGLRVGEFLALTRADVDPDARTVTVRKSKTAAGRRTVPIAAKTLPFWLDTLESAAHDPETRIFDDGGLERTRYDRFRAAMDVALDAADLPPHLPHDTRHTAATLLHAAGVDPYIVKKILGHSSRDVTERVYTHLTVADLIEAIDRI